MFPGIPGLVPNGTFPSTATIATSVPGAIKMEFPQNGYVSVCVTCVSVDEVCHGNHMQYWCCMYGKGDLSPGLSIDKTLSYSNG